MADTTEKPEARLRHWDRLAHRRGPNLLRWMLVSLIARGVMLYGSPIVSSTSVLIFGCCRFAISSDFSARLDGGDVHVRAFLRAHCLPTSTIDTTGAKNGVGVRGFYSPVEAAEKHRPY